MRPLNFGRIVERVPACTLSEDAENELGHIGHILFTHVALRKPAKLFAHPTPPG